MKSFLTRDGDLLILTVQDNGDEFVFPFRTEAELRAKCEELGIPVPRR